MNVEKIKIVPVREAFRHEAHNFTVWLESNIDALSERIGIELTVIEREKSVGSFNVDLFCHDKDGKYVIVENQLERSDHDHLGKLLTYLVNLDAKTAVWVTPEVRPEHERVIDWLNESTGADYSFYLVQVEAARIGDSPYAPLFTVLAAPDEQTREIGDDKKELAEGQLQLKKFWTQLLEGSKGRTKLFSGRSPGTDSWLSTGSGRSGIRFVYRILQAGVGVELHINVHDQQRNKAIYDELYSDKTSIETDFGDFLKWERLVDKKSCRISWLNDENLDLSEPETWSALQDMLIEAMTRFDAALKPRIAKLSN